MKQAKHLSFSLSAPAQLPTVQSCHATLLIQWNLILGIPRFRKNSNARPLNATSADCPLMLNYSESD